MFHIINIYYLYIYRDIVYYSIDGYLGDVLGAAFYYFIHFSS